MLQISNSTQNYNPSFGRIILSHSAERALEMGDYLTKHKLESLDALLKKAESKKNCKPVDVFVDYSNPIRLFKNMFKQSNGEFNVYLGKNAKAPLFFSLPERMFNDPLVNIVKKAIEKIKQQNRGAKL